MDLSRGTIPASTAAVWVDPGGAHLFFHCYAQDPGQLLGDYAEMVARHLRRMRELYAARLAVLLEHGRARWRGLLELSPVDAGLQTAAWLAPGLIDTDVAAAAARRGVGVTPLSRYTRGPVLRQGLMLGFASVDEAEIRRGVRELGIAAEQLAG